MSKYENLQCSCCKEYFRDGVIKELNGNQLCKDCYGFVSGQIAEVFKRIDHILLLNSCSNSGAIDYEDALIDIYQLQKEFNNADK